ncbi:uncharacterized protein [Leptinotarsa decemlineata]|uniref:uncharacterized protein n=1 Tax=Leptinotarsa decemlineata TaxID=7539 RepID=UPI003D306AE5
MDEKLIELVRNHEELYNMGDKLYFDTALKNRIWTEIAEKLNETADKCKQRWESLRSKFRKICKANGTTTGQAAKKKKKWRYEDEMTFLLPHMMDEARVSSLQIHDGTDEENIDGNDEE